MDVPSMVQRSGDTLIVRSVVSGNQIYVDQGTGNLLKPSAVSYRGFDNYRSQLEFEGSADGIEELETQNESKDEGLPQCKIKRNYSCNSCTFFTQNPRHFLTHLRDNHGEKIVINECKLCLYASRHYQKLVRHMKMVHGSTEGIEEHSQARKRQMGREHRKRKIDVEHSTHASNPTIPQQILTQIEKYEEPLQEEGPQNRLLKCSVCEFTTLYRAQLVDHEQDEHYKTKFFRCEKCSYVTHIKARFSKHVKYHSMPMIKCVTCDFRTPYKWNLDRHMKNHGGTGPFKCAACNFTADIKQSLTVHEMNHHVPPVGHAAGMSMARRKNKVGATDIPEDFLSENGDISDSYNNNNNIDDFEEPFDKKFKIDDDDQPTDLSQKGDVSRKPARPIPNLIPIQTANNALNLTKNLIYEQFSKIVQKELALSKGSSKDIAYFLENGEMCMGKIEGPQLSPSSNGSSTASKKKGSFFVQLKENFAATVSKNENLICGCGHTSKCLSESIIHQKSCCKEDQDKLSSQSPINLSVNSGSTRCQYCRHRCKSSVDLLSHLKTCTEAGHCRNESFDSSSDSREKNEDVHESNTHASSSPHEKHPMENRVFVWNNLPDSQRDDRSYGEQEIMDEGDEEKAANDGSKSFDYLSEDQKKENSENSYYGVETAPGYGEVTKKMTPEEEAANSSLKKVYKCPHCSFWASTASRFHVHIVGHLNKKPFECSLCNYRSNWRWDITKHIRLKTIRDPNHKNAKVLMNDETGRRNYTKYNKYITLMKVTEEDGDPKLMKSGEMTPNQEASLAFLNEYKRDGGDFNGQIDAGPSKNLSPIDATRMMRMTFFPNAILGMPGSQSVVSQPEQTKRSPPPLLKPSEDILTQNIDVKPDGSDKRTMYKCRKCNYRNVSRDMVLSHVKGHYQEAGITIPHNNSTNLPNPLQVAVNPSLYMKNVLAAAMCLSQQHQQQQQQFSLKETSPQNQSLLSSSSPSPPGPPISQHHILPHQNLNLNPNQLQQLPSVVNNNNNNNTNINSNTVIPLNVGTPPTTINQTATNCASNEHGEADERHCRLKHNGDIRIETIDRNSDKNSPVYYPLNSQPSSYSNTTNAANVLSSCTSTSGNNKIFSHDQPQLQTQKLLNGSQFVSPTTAQSSNNNAYKNTEQEQQPSTTIAPANKSRQHQCPSCPFVSESKSQMMYHNSLHKYKSDVYQCHQCDYTCYKKQVLTQHIKTCHDDEQQEVENDQSNQNETNDRSISFCPRCPARYIGSKDLNLHLKMHAANYSHRCGVCSYTALQEPSLLSHSAVHSQSYDEKTAKLRQKFVEDVHYPRPKLASVVLSSGEKIWMVERNTEPDTDLDDAIAKSIICMDDDARRDRKPSLLKQQLELNGDSGDSISDYSTQHCPHCPFETSRTSPELKTHLENHISVSNKKRSSTCMHCDFSVSDDKILKDHVALHFKSIKNNSVAFYTSYDKMELNLVEEDECDKTMTRARKQQLLFKSDQTNGLLDRQQQQSNTKNDPSQQQEKTIVDATTGEILSRSSM